MNPETKGRAQPDWKAVAMVYRKRLNTICVLAAFASYVAMAYVTSLILEWLHLDSAWVETIAMIVWLPLGAVAYYIKNRLEDWAERGAEPLS